MGVSDPLNFTSKQMLPHKIKLGDKFPLFGMYKRNILQINIFQRMQKPMRRIT